MDDLNMLVISVVSAALLGGIKMLGPVIKEKVPNFVWPIALIVLAKVGTNICVYFDAACSGSPLSWTSVDANTLSVAMVAILGREGLKSTQKGAKTIRTWAESKGYIPPQGG